MSLIWTDIQDIVLELDERYPEVDPNNLNFVDLMNWIVSLPDFDDDKERCGEKILEAVQMAWIEERQD
mgnify:CR=1 FL=1|tara:strand:+ start:58 stop:261 length:204 start_codon:yes stop_codon:yes gene_type:complete